jgi:phenylalanyl-tRNA synthetase beta chain
MKFSFSWLKEWVDLPYSAEELSNILTMGGLEVESMTPAAPPFSGVVIAKILEAVQHPNADRLRVCTVDIGQAEPLQIVCGAPNARAGIVVPCATVGAVLAGDFKIGKAKMRGVESFGMLCSGKELGVSVDADGLWELPPNLTIGQNVREAMQLDDVTYEIKLTPNLAHVMSIQGIAREVAVLTGQTLRPLNINPIKPTQTETLSVKVADSKLCGRFAGRIIRNVNAKAPTPDWMKQKLERAGQRPISALVDISNYVLLSLGRPTHVFDLDKIKGGLQVRWAKESETLTLLNEQTITLSPNVGVVADNNGALSLAGIMGGSASAVSDDTTSVYVEGAFWWPEAMMGRARRFGLSTDASQRFERGVDAATIPEHLDYITDLILQICGGEAGPLDDQVLNIPQPSSLRVRLSRAEKIIGIPAKADEVMDIFTRLRFQPKTVDSDTIEIQIPSDRFDLSIEADLIEEIARVMGYERIPANMPKGTLNYITQPETQVSIHAVRHQLANWGYQETVNYSFTDPARDAALNPHHQKDRIQVQNPISPNLSVMRTSLWSSLLAVLQHNTQRKQTRVRVFEIGRIFLRDSTVQNSDWQVAGVSQPKRLAGLAYGTVSPEQWGVESKKVDFFDVKADVQALLNHLTDVQYVKAEHPALHPGRSARLEHNGKPIGWLGELHPQHVQQLDLNSAPILFELDWALIQTRPLPQSKPLSAMPPVQRDLALIVPKTLTYQSVQDIITQYAKQHTEVPLQQVNLFDRYAGEHVPEGHVSLAFRLVLQDLDKTLEDASVEAWVAGLLAALKEKGVVLR